MSDEVTISIVFNDLPAIAAALQPNANKAARQTAESIAEMAQSLAPVRTGRLRDSITVDQDSEGATVSTDVNYAVFQEYGTSHDPARPYITPAAEGERAAFTDRVAETIIETK